MNYLHNPNKVIIHCGWLDTDFIIWGEQKQHKKYAGYSNFQYPFLYEAFELKLQLFKKDPASFYGTFIETENAVIHVPIRERIFHSEAGQMQIYQAKMEDTIYPFPLEGIVLSVDCIPNYMALFADWKQLDNIANSYEMHYWLSLFTAIEEEIKQGHFLPGNHAKWELNKFPIDEWYEALPPASYSLYRSSPFIQKEEQMRDNKERLRLIIHQLADTFIRYLIKHDPVVQDAYQTLKKNEKIAEYLVYLENSKEQLIENDQFLLEELGAVPSSPFQTGLLIEEPRHEEGEWKLSLFIQDKEDPSFKLFLADLKTGSHPWRTNPIPKVKKDLMLAAKKVPLLSKLSIITPELLVGQQEVYNLLTQDYVALKKRGFTVIAPDWWDKDKVSVKASLDLSFHSSVLRWEEIANFDYQVSVNDVTLSEEEFLEYVRLKEPFIRIRGKWMYWDVEKAEKLKEHLETKKSSMSYFQAMQLFIQTAGEEDEELTIHWEKNIEQQLIDLYNKRFRIYDSPVNLKGELRPYQQEGMSWLLHMREMGFGACLADDMGLGKSIQTIAYLLALAEQNKLTKSFLLICPTSLIGNWSRELTQFAPQLSYYIHHGTNRLEEEQLAQRLNEYSIVITSYSLAFRDIELFSAFEWEGLILDEAQQVKNIETKQRKAIKKIKSAHRIALTGTPIENRLTELWSIIDLLNHQYLGSFKRFKETFVKSIEGEDNKTRLEELQQLISPFLLRRKKSDQALQLQLPKKQEQTYYIGLTVEQASLYQGVIQQLFHSFDRLSQMERRALILSSLTKLKQICNHPAQFLKEQGPLADRSEKWELLNTLVEQITEREEKVLIFTQYKEMGLLLQKGLSEKYGKEISFLHGSLQRHKREEMIEDFKNNQENNIFILSLKAGGVGLNLTAANHVIHYDRWWNPAVEKQATDRVYRIGQTEDVTVHTFITKGTLEEKINKIIMQKQQLSDTLLTAGENSMTELTFEELKDLLELTYV